MKYLIEHHETFYYRRKLRYKNICLSLKTKNKVEAKYIINIINSKIELMRHYMNFEEEIEYIRNVIKQYVDEAKAEYSALASVREKKYKYTKPNGKVILGSHPIAIENAIEDLQDDLYSEEKNTVVQSIVDDSNIKSEFREALIKLSDSGKQRLRDEIIKSEIELLYFDKIRNESRVKEDKFQPTYTEEFASSINNYNQPYSNALEIVKEIDNFEKSKYKIKNKYEAYDSYVETVKDAKANTMDKVNLSIKTLLQASDKEYLIDYTLEDYENFFKLLIYTPAHISLKKKLYQAYNENIADIAEEYKSCLDNGEECFSEYGYAIDLQSSSNVDEKLNNVIDFLNECTANDIIIKNYLYNNKKFSKSKYENILKSRKERKPFSIIELQNMMNLMADEIDIMGFNAEIFYIPLIALYSGMRVEEICKLKTSDIVEKDTVWCFDINGLVKSTNSKRIVPIHKDLIEKFNFLKYVTNRKDKELLFALNTIYKGKKLKYSHYFLRDFTRLRDDFVSLERIENDLISFHSFRHTFATNLDVNDVNYADIAELLGHSVDYVIEIFEDIERNNRTNITKRYIHKGKPSITHLQEQIEKLYLDELSENISLLEKKFKSMVKY